MIRHGLLAVVTTAGLAACAYDPHYDYAYDPYGPPPGAYYGAPPPAYGPAPGTNTALGTVGGAVVGGLLGSTIGRGSGQVAATVGGAVLGGLVGGGIGNQLDESNRRAAWAAQQQAFTNNSVTSWGTPGAPTYGSVEPLRTYVLDGRYCREYQHTLYIDGRPQQARGTACQMPNGTWQVIS